MKTPYFLIFFFGVLLISCKSTKSISTNENTNTSSATTPIVKKTIKDSSEIEIPDWITKKENPKKEFYQAENQRNFKLLNTKLEVRFDWKKQHLHGKATLQMKPWFYPQSEVILDAKGFDIHKVALINLADTSLLNFSYDSALLKIQLPKKYTSKTIFNLFIEYTAKPNDLEIGGSKAITSDKGLYFINPLGIEPNKPQQIWTQGETQSSSCWFPTFDSPNTKTSQEIYITVDSVFTTLSNGKLIFQRNNNDGTRTDYWKQEKPHSPYLFMMTVGKFSVVKDRWKNMEVNYYVEPKYEPFAKAIFGNTPEMLDFFSKKLKYQFPWDKYSQIVVRDYVSGAMENTSATIFMEDLQVGNRYLLDENWDNIIAHELFHHWFGDLVTCESWSNLPLNESFANYSEYLWQEYKYGIDEADLHWENELADYLEESEHKQENLIRFRYADREDMFDSHSYSKGGLILHSLRKYVGDAAFFESLHIYLTQNEFKNTEIHHLRLAFEQVTGQDLNWFFNQWFLSSGHPELSVSDFYENGEITLKIVQNQNLKYTPVFRLPVKVAIWIKGRKQEHQITITKQSETFTFKAEQQPDLVLFDSETQIVGLVNHEKTAKQYIFQYKNATKFLSKQEALFKLREKLNNKEVRNLFIEALRSSFWAISEMAISVFESYEGDDKDLIVKLLKKLTTEYPHYLVRSSALEILATIENVPNLAAIAEKAMTDSSYYVMATALYIYAEFGGTNIIQELEKLEYINDINLYEIIGYYYSAQKVPNKSTWYLKKIAQEKGEELQLLISYFGVYLLNQDEVTQRKAIPQLKMFAEHSSNTALQKTAISSLSMLVNIPEITQILKKLQAKETDKDVLQHYREALE